MQVLEGAMIKQQVNELLQRGVGTAIIFIELVRGCDNRRCPSWGTVCNYGGIHYMTDKTLDGVLSAIQNASDVLSSFDKVDVWPYGCGDPTRHPQLPAMLHTIHDALPYPLALSVDSNAFLPAGEWANFVRMKVMHKLPQGKWLDDANRWNAEYGSNGIQHGIIANTISYGLWQEVMQAGGRGIKKGRTFLTIPFGGTELPDTLPDYRRVSFSIDSLIPIERQLYSGLLAKRTMFAWDGSLRRCLVAGTDAPTFRDLLEEPVDRCARCFSSTGGELINFFDNHVLVEEFACCVSDRPL